MRGCLILALAPQRPPWPKPGGADPRALLRPPDLALGTARQQGARAIEAGLQAAPRNGTFRDLFLEHHKAEIDFVRRSHQRLIPPAPAPLPERLEPPDTSWWWPPGVGPQR